MTQESGRNINTTQEPELRARQEATELLNALKEKEGKKAFFLVVDDKPASLEGRQELITTYAATRNTRHVISLKKDGESALRLYQAFREQEDPEQRNKVVAVLDWELDRCDRLKYGKQVAQKLVEISTANGWEVPYEDLAQIAGTFGAWSAAPLRHSEGGREYRREGAKLY